MTNTMADLRKECAERMREALHGKEIDTLENTVGLPHMLGIVPVGVNSNHKVEDDTLLDPSHEFWTEFEEDVRTKGKAQRKIQSAIRSLTKDGIFTKTYPYGEEADIVYCEVEQMEAKQDTLLETKCVDCGESIEVPLSLSENGGSYSLDAVVNCPHCDFSGLFESVLVRR